MEAAWNVRGMIVDGLDGDDWMARRIEGKEMCYKELL